jgi:hypothetical protein
MDCLVIDNKNRCFEYTGCGTYPQAAMNHVETELVKTGRCSLTMTEWETYKQILVMLSAEESILAMNAIIKTPQNRIRQIVHSYTTSFLKNDGIT